jgi:iron complex transport system substrate-binding protein
MRRPHRLLAAASALTVAVALAACSGTSSDGAAGAGSATSAPDTITTGSWPASIEHRWGTTTIDQRPARIVSLDNQWTDVLVALDAPLVGAALDPVAETGRYPWQEVIPESVTDIEVGDSIPYEAVAALNPDLIVITWGATSQADYDRLSQIAPTIGQLGDEEVDAWQDIAEVAGRLLGESDAAAALVTEIDRLVAGIATELPGLQGKTYALANYVPSDGIYVVADPDDGSATFFAQLGLAIDPDLIAIADGASGRAKLSLERIDELDADVLVLLTNGADPAQIPGYAALPAVAAGSVALLDLDAVTGLNTPTPLSLPYAIERVRPALEAAAAR